MPTERKVMLGDSIRFPACEKPVGNLQLASTVLLAYSFVRSYHNAHHRPKVPVTKPKDVVIQAGLVVAKPALACNPSFAAVTVVASL